MKRLLVLLAAMAWLCFLAFGVTGALALAPTVSQGTVSQVTSESALLEAEINPRGKASEYHFEYGTVDCSVEPSACASSQSGSTGKGESPIKVKIPVSGLSAGTTYHFRLLAKNGDGETPGPDATFATYQPPQQFGPCPNDQFRSANPAAARIEYSSANLPDCRAYEQATPVDKNGGDATGTVPYIRASLDGNGIVFISVSGVPGGKGSQELPSYLATRGAGAWQTQGLLPPAAFGQRANVIGWTPDFQGVYSEVSKLGPPPLKTAFLAASGAGATPVEATDYIAELNPRFAGASAGGALVLFESQVALPEVPDSVPGKSNLYLWNRETQKLSLADVLNEEEAPPSGAFAGSYDWVQGTSPPTLAKGGSTRGYYTQEQHAISADGSAIYFTAAGSGKLYVRLNPTEEQSDLDSEGNCTKSELACTVQVNTSRKDNGDGPDGTDPAGPRPAAFMGASADGSKSFFISSEKLTNDANTGPEQEPGVIERADIGGTNVNPSCVPAHATGVAVDASHVYWANSAAATIGRANLNCGEVEEDFIATGSGSPQYVAVDAAHIYWTNDAVGEEPGVFPGGKDGAIGRADISGKADSVETDFIAGLEVPQGIAVDASHIYWANAEDVGSSINRTNLDGENVDIIFDEFKTFYPRGLAVDGTHVYWTSNTNGGSSFVNSIKLDGSEFLPVFLGEGTKARGIALDNKYVYWASQGEKGIGRIDLDLTEASIERKFLTTAGLPDGVAVDASHIYWAVNGNTLPNPGRDLYSYDTKTQALEDLAPDSTDENGTEALGVLGTSKDGSYVYFAANGVPDGVTNSPNSRGEAAEAGSCPYELGPSEHSRCNLYLAHDGEVRFIARLESGGTEVDTDAANWPGTPTGVFPTGNFQKTGKVSDDGQTLLFRSQRQLTSYRNEGTSELYRYHVGGGGVRCVSCNPTGAAPSPFGQVASFGGISPSAVIPRPPASVGSHNLSADGSRVFFETTDALVGADTNGDAGCPQVGAVLQGFFACTDVYEWEAQGTGSCDAAHAVADGGCIYLISTGKGTEPALIADASADGKNVFFFSRSRLVGQDEDQLLDVYDARVEGGLASQNQPPQIPCEGEACKPAANPPPPVPAPPKFSGPPNPKPGCAKGKHKVKGKCVAKKKHKGKKKHKPGKGKAQAKGGSNR